MTTAEINKFSAYKKKLEGICDDNNLNFKFRNDRYPITLTIYPVTGLDAQMSMFESIEECGYKGENSSIVFIAKDGGITYRTCDTFTISDALFSKIKNLFKNLCAMWFQHFFHDIVARNLLIGENFPTVEVTDEQDAQEETYGEDDVDTEDAMETAEDEVQ